MARGSGAVVVTGASTGIGEACAKRLAAEGFTVFAGVRKEEDAERAAAAGTTPLRIDVTDQASIEAAAHQVTEATGAGGLAGLVNNAGVAVGGPLEYVDIDELRRQLEVNVIGPVAVTQALMPSLRKATGRIVNISSIGGRMAAPMLGPYAASKFALEAISDSLRRELRPWGMHVSVVEPGTIATEIWDKASGDADRMEAGLTPEAREHYGDLIAFMRSEISANPGKGLAPDAVAKVVSHALTASRPRTRYLVGREAKATAALAGALPDRAFDALIARMMKV